MIVAEWFVTYVSIINGWMMTHDNKGRCCHNDVSIFEKESLKFRLQQILEIFLEDGEPYMQNPNKEHSAKLKLLENFVVSIEVAEDDQRVWESSPMT